MGSSTSKHGFYKPTENEDGWAATLNANNWDALDARVPLLDADYGFWGSALFTPSSFTTSIMAGLSNQVRVARIFLPCRTTIRRIVFEVTTASAGGFCSVGIYSADGNTRLLHTGAVATDTTGVKNISITPVTLDPGVYWLAWTADNTIAQARFLTLGTNAATIENTVAARRGSAANASSAGVLPTTLGTITAASITAIAAFFDTVA